MHDFDPTISPYNGHMLCNLSKYYLFICCKQSISTHFCHFLTTTFAIDVLAGSNPSAMGLKKRKASIAGGLTIQWWAMRDVRVRLAPPASASSLRSSRAALENASRFLSSAPCRIRIPALEKKKARHRRGNGLLRFCGAPSGIRTRDIHLERVASLAARRWGQRERV